MGALCVRKGVRADREKDPQKMGGARHREISPKRRVSTKKVDQKSFKNFCFFLLTLLAPRDNLIVPKGGKDLQKMKVKDNVEFISTNKDGELMICYEGM